MARCARGMARLAVERVMNMNLPKVLGVGDVMEMVVECF